MGGFSNTLGLYFEIAADPSNAQAKLKEFQTSVEQTLGAAKGSFGLISSDIEQRFGLAAGSIAKTGLAAQAAAKDLAYLGAGVAGIGTLLFAVAEKAAHFAEQIGHVAEKSGATAEQVSTLKFAADRVGISFEAVDKGLGFLAKNLGNLGTTQGKAAALALEDIGVKARDAQGHLKPMSALLPEIVTGLGKLESGNVKTADSVALLGRGGKELIPVLNEMRQGFDVVERQARSMGMVIGDEDVKAARVFLLEQRTLTAELQAFSLAIGRDVMPVVTQLFIRLENYPSLFSKIGYEFLRLGVIAAAVPSLGGSLLALPVIQAKIAEKTKEMDQAITNGLVKLDAEARAALAAGINIDKHVASTQKLSWETERLLAAIGRFTDLSRTLQAQLDSGTSPAMRRYLEVEEKLAELGLKLDVSMLRRQNQAIYQKQLTEELAKSEVKFTDQLLNQSGILSTLTTQMPKLTEEERARLPLIYDETNALARLLGNSQSVVAEMMLRELPARQRIEIEIQRQINEADREIAKDRQLYAQKKITRAQLEAAEKQYTATVNSLSKQRELRLDQEINQAKLRLKELEWSLDATANHFENLKEFGLDAFEGLAQAMGSSIADAIVYEKSIGAAMAAALKATLASIASEAITRAIEATALGFLRLAQFEYAAAGQAFTSAAIWASIGGVAAIAGRALPGGETGASARPEVGGTLSPAAAGTAAPAALAPGAASAAARAQTTSGGGAGQPAPIIINIHGDFLATPHSADKLIAIIKDAVLHRDADLPARRALLPTYAAR